jgi:hypothetical protein
MVGDHELSIPRAEPTAHKPARTVLEIRTSLRVGYGRSGWFEVGGTSLASPLVAAVYALG